MRFVSCSARYQTCFQTDVIEHYATGESRITRPLLNVEFRPDGWTTLERDEATKRFLWRGLPTERDEVTVVDPTFRIGTWDSEEYQRTHNLSDEKRVEIEQWLLGHPDYGTMFFEVIVPRAAAPWPTYDTFRGVRGMPTADRIAERVREDGYDVAAVIQYEKENANRQPVIDALEALAAAPPVRDEELVSA